MVVRQRGFAYQDWIDNIRTGRFKGSLTRPKHTTRRKTWLYQEDSSPFLSMRVYSSTFRIKTVPQCLERSGFVPVMVGCVQIHRLRLRDRKNRDKRGSSVTYKRLFIRDDFRAGSSRECPRSSWVEHWRQIFLGHLCCACLEQRQRIKVRVYSFRSLCGCIKIIILHHHVCCRCGRR